MYIARLHRIEPKVRAMVYKKKELTALTQSKETVCTFNSKIH